MNETVKLYVSLSGDDSACGCQNAPFKTFGRALAEVREILAKNEDKPIDVYFSHGKYSVSGVEMNEADSGRENAPVRYCAVGDGEVVFSGGVTVDPNDFELVSGEMANRLSEDARKNVYVCDLKKYGIEHETVNPLHPFGLWSQNKNGTNCEVFCNNRRMKLARYPNEGFSRVQRVCFELDPQTAELPADAEKRSKVAPIEVADDVNERIKRWQEPGKAWAFGFFGYDWADNSSPLEYVDTEKKIIKMQTSPPGSYHEGARFFVYNAFEELDFPGEYYIDRENLLLYVYPTSDIKVADIMLTVNSAPLIKAKNVDYITFENISFEGSREEGMVVEGNNWTIKNCFIHSVGGFALLMTGYNHLLCDSEITSTGKGGVIFEGGDKVKFLHGNCEARNNYIHDWAENDMTYNAAIRLNGCGNIARHNELAYTSHAAILYENNDHLIEYNYIHDVVRLSSDAGAIYCGYDWTGHETVLRYNIIENVGGEDNGPAGIYFDDALSGQTAYCNIIINSRGQGFLIGGGRDHKVYNNIIIGSEYPILYDDRVRSGLLENGWFQGGKPDSRLWKSLHDVDRKSGVWFERFPHLAELIDEYTLDESVVNKPNFPANPANSVVTDNICVKRMESDYGNHIMKSVFEYSKVENNPVFNSADECLIEGTYEPKKEIYELVPNFKAIPKEELEKIGRIKG